MQPAMPPAGAEQPARRISSLRIGLIFGVGVGVILIVLSLLSQLVLSLAGIINILSIVVALVAFFFAGYRASQQSGRMREGLFAGMWTGIISEALDAVASTLLLLPHLHDFAKAENQLLIESGAQLSAPLSDTTVLLFFIAANVIGVILIGAIALGIGAIGGAIGKGRAPLPTQVYQESLYQPPPAGGYPPRV